MAMSGLSVKLKNLTFATNTRSSVEPALLEKSSKVVGTSGTDVQYRILCGLTPNLLIAPRYVVQNATALPLYGNEALAIQNYVSQRGLSRGTSVYYRIQECSMLAYLTINVNSHNIRDISYAHLAVYALPAKIYAKDVVCKPVCLNPGIEHQIIQMMLTCIWNRGIFE